MAGIRLQPEDSDVSQQSRAVSVSAADLVSDDDRSVAADSWSIKSEYGSTLDDDQRHADAAEALSNANFRAASDYRSIPLSLSMNFEWFNWILMKFMFRELLCRAQELSGLLIYLLHFRCLDFCSYAMRSLYIDIGETESEGC